MRTALVAIVLSGLGGAVCAQTANEASQRFEPCFEAARAADQVCSNRATDAVARLACFQDVRATLLQCMQQVPPETATGPPPSEPAPPEPSTDTGSFVATGAPALSAAAAPNQRAGTGAPESPGTVTPSDASAEVAPPRMVAATTASANPSKAVSPDLANPDPPKSDPPKPEPPNSAAASNQPAEPVAPPPALAAVPTEKSSGTDAPNPPVPSEDAAPPEFPTATVSPDKPTLAATPAQPAPAVDAAAKPVAANWVVSETTSPVDYTPLVTAALRSPSDQQDGPSTLAIRCRAGGTDLMVRTEGKWRASRAGDLQVEYQINTQPAVKTSWIASADGKMAVHKNDTIGLLQSLPQDAQLKISVLDGSAPVHQSTFQLAGFDALRKKIAAACKWPVATQKSRDKH
jgi:hypothetical protein